MPMPARKITCRGETLTISEWSKRSGVPVPTIRSRIDEFGWDAEPAIFTPVQAKFRGGGRHAAAEGIRPCPKMKRHKASGLAYCRWSLGGEKHCKYFGEYGSDEARREYARFARQWAENECQAATSGGKNGHPRPRKGQPIQIAPLVERFLEWAEKRYVKNGKQTSEVGCFRSALGIVLDLFPHVPAEEFTLKDLEACQARMVELGWKLNTVRLAMCRLVRLFKWGAKEKLVPVGVWHELKLRDPVLPGQIEETEPKLSVPNKDIEAIFPYLHQFVEARAMLAAMIEVQRLTGMRPSPLTGMRLDQIDRIGDVWFYAVPGETNKNHHRKKKSSYWFGPRTQRVLKPWLAVAVEGMPIFSYMRPRGKLTSFTRYNYGECIRRACKRAGVPHWHPHRLRHNKATDVKRIYEDDEKAAAAIGDSVEVAREIYIDPMDAVRRRIAKETG
jgi:integrase